jgi:WD40 repeat protein
MTDDVENAGEKLKVFISYSRRDAADFAEEVVAGLELAGFAPFIDRLDIKPGEPWEDRLGLLIAQSDTVVFVITPEAVKSERCAWEVERTLELSKRLLPVVYKRVPESEIPEKLRRLQFVRFDTGRALARSIAELAEALRADLDWIREHTRLGELATRWVARQRPESLLLRGDDLDAVKAWMAQRTDAAPAITEAQRTFIAASEHAESARLGKERAQLEAMAHAQAATARQQRRATRLLWGVATLVLAMIGYVTWKDYDVAKRELNVFTARATDAMKDEQFDRAMRYALMAYPARGSIPWLTPFSTELEGKLAGAAQSSRSRDEMKADGSARLEGHSGSVQSAAFSPDSRRVVTASADNTARIWDAGSGKQILRLDHTGSVHSAAFSPDGKRVVTASGDGTIRIWDADSGKQIMQLEGNALSEARALIPNSNWVVSAGFSPDGKRVVTASATPSDYPTLRIWDADSGKEIAPPRWPYWDITERRFKMHGTASDDDIPRIWDAYGDNNGPVVLHYLGAGHFFGFAQGPYWRYVTLGNQKVPNDTADNVRSAAFSPDRRRVVTGADDRTARTWDPHSGREIVPLKGHAGSVWSAAFSPDGRRVVTASEDGTARIWDVTWAALVRGDTLRERVCAEKLHDNQEFNAAELDDPILRGLEINPCLRRGPLSLGFWMQLPERFLKSFQPDDFSN